MFRTATALSLIALLAACDNQQPFTFGVTEPEAVDNEGVVADPTDPDEPLVLSGFTNNGTATAIPENVAGNLLDVSFTPGSSTITVTGPPLDTTPIPGTFTRNSSLDIPGYVAYSVQEDPLDRMYIALLAESANGAVEGGVAIDGGQFGTFFGGAFYRRNDGYTAYVPSQPGQGLVTYTGDYAGLANLNAPRSGSVDILPLPPGVADGSGIAPREPDRVVGTVFINADFADNQLNGAIINRRLLGRGDALLDINLVPTEITADGTFVGAVELDADQTNIGTYAGTFGGTEASAIAGTINIENYIEAIENEQEYGAFVLMRCGLTGEGALCATVDP